MANDIFTDQNFTVVVIGIELKPVFTCPPTTTTTTTQKLLSRLADIYCSLRFVEQLSLFIIIKITQHVGDGISFQVVVVYTT